MKKYLLPLVFLMSVFGLLLAQEVKLSSAVKKRLDEKLRRYRANHEKQCRERALKEASRLADSLMLEYANTLADTANIPPLPEKPERPPIKPLKDTLGPEPLFRE